MDLLNISYTEESSVLKEGEIHLPCMRIRIWPMPRLCTVISRHHGLVLSMSDFGNRGPGSIPGLALTTTTFFFSFSFFLL